MLKLVCIVVGDGEPFAVEMAASTAVALLMDKVLETKSKSIHCDANKLKLYVAKTLDGTCLDMNDAKEVALDDDGNLQHYEMMNPLHLINHYFDATDVARKRIHVLVVVPEGEFRPASGKRSIEDIGKIVEASVHKAMREFAAKVSVHSLSTMDSPKKHRLLRKMALKQTVIGMEEPRDTSIPGFEWNDELDENHEHHRAQYMTYLETHLTTLLGKFMLKDVANNKSMLNTVDPRLPFGISGTADVLLIDKSKAINVMPLSGLCLVINLKKKVESCHLGQAIGQLVCASIKTPHNCCPMSLLTDLNGTWVFSYFSDKNMLTHIEFHYPKNAVDFIKATVEEHAALPLPYLSAPFKKLRVDDFLPHFVDGHAAERMENFELMADELEPEYLTAKRVEYAQNVVQSMPMYS